MCSHQYLRKLVSTGFSCWETKETRQKPIKTKKPRNSETYVPFSGNPLREGDAETPETPETCDGNYVIIIFNTMVILPLANTGGDLTQSHGLYISSWLQGQFARSPQNIREYSINYIMVTIIDNSCGTNKLTTFTYIKGPTLHSTHPPALTSTGRRFVCYINRVNYNKLLIYVFGFWVSGFPSFRKPRNQWKPGKPGIYLAKMLMLLEYWNTPYSNDFI